MVENKFCFNLDLPVSLLHAAGWLVVTGCWLVNSCWGTPDSGGAVPGVVTNLAELYEAAVLEEAIVADLKIEGTVWWASRAEGQVILKDDTSVLHLELDVPGQMPDLGDHLVLEGNCLVVKTRDVVKLSGVPVVENGGLHPPKEQQGTIHLKAGHHPIRVVWFNRTDRYGLEVSYVGPEINRRQIADEVLFRPEIDAVTGTTNFVNGLRYRYYEGAWWSQLPNFDHILPEKTGIVENFDITLRDRDNHVGLLFDGYIEVLRDGLYTFYVKSDDGSRLFIGDSSLRVDVVGQGVISSPNPLTEGAVQDGQPEFQWSEIQGTVTSFHRSHGTMEIDLMTPSGIVRLKVAEDSDYSYILRPQNRIRAVGVSRRIHHLDGALICGEFFVQEWSDIEQQYITPRIWSEYPLVKIENLRTAESSGIVGSVVHLNGTIISKGGGQPAVLEDGTGWIILDDLMPDEFVGRSSDVLGLLSLDGTNLVLSSARFRQLGELESETGNLPVLTTAEQVGQLSLDEAARGYPVRLRGVITSPGEYDGAVLQDSSRGIYLWFVKPDDVDPDDWEPIAVQMGDYCEIEGVTAPYQFNPFIQVTRLQKLGTGALPEPVQPTWDQLINGNLHCNYVELEGVVASIKDDTVALMTRDGRINVRLNPIGPNMPHDALGATVRLRGCLLADWDGESRQVVVGSIYLDQHRITMVHPAPVDPFSIPLKQVGDLLQFDPQAGALQRVKVSGQLVYQDEQASYLMDGVNGLRFISVETGSAQVGDRLEVVGFVDLSGVSPLLRDAVIRRLEPDGLLMPQKLDANELVQDVYDSTLVQVEGVLLGVSSRPEGAVFEMQSGLRRFMAMVGDRTGLDEVPKPGSHLELTGVYVGQGGNRVLGRPIDSFELLLNSGRDVRVLSRPPWWTLKRLLLVVGLLLGILLASFVWINLLHQKVEERTQQLGDQIRQRQRAERERAIEQERARLAHDLHDDLGAGLTEVNMLSSLVKNPAIANDKRNSYADKMNTLALRMVTSLDEIVWAENPRNDTVSSLADYFESYARRLLEPAAMGCIFKVGDNVPDHPLDPRFRQGLFLAFKEALSNVLKHAEASEVRLGLSVEGGELVVIVSDDGCGILSDTHEAGADGLVNMQERLSALGGSCEIQSDPAKGTSIRMRAPIRRLAT